MSYVISGSKYENKALIENRCREILRNTPDGQVVCPVAMPFLFELFQFHDEWVEKSSPAVKAISTQTTAQGNRCFVLLRVDDSKVDISFKHAVRRIPSSRARSLVPQGLRDYCDAARTAINEQIRQFRDRELVNVSVCPVTQVPLTRDNVAVDHVFPLTFSQLLRDFTEKENVNPLCVKVCSEGGTIATFADSALSKSWEEYHRANCQLRVISSVANLQLKRSRIDWRPLLEG